MSKRPTEITDENILTVDVATIAVDRRFPNLEFPNAKKKLSKTQKWLSEIEEFDYKELLVEGDINQINSLKSQLKEHLQSLLTFENRTTEANAQQEHNSLESRIDSYYNSAYQHLATRILPFLRNEAARSSQDKQELEKQQKAAAQAEKKYKELAEKMELQLQTLDEKKKSIEKISGEIAASTFGKHFEAQAEEHSEKVSPWSNSRELFFKWILGIIIGNFVLYLLLFILNKINPAILAPKEFFTPEYGVIKITLLAILFYGLSFASKNYRINSNLEVINKHRKNVAETLKHFLDTNMANEDRSHIVRSATEAMFKNASTGYVSGTDSKDDGPMLEVINNILKNSKNE